jgi:hypothetical protein
LRRFLEAAASPTGCTGSNPSPTSGQLATFLRSYDRGTSAPTLVADDTECDDSLLWFHHSDTGSTTAAPQPSTDTRTGSTRSDSISSTISTSNGAAISPTPQSERDLNLAKAIVERLHATPIRSFKKIAEQYNVCPSTLKDYCKNKQIAEALVKLGKSPDISSLARTVASVHAGSRVKRLTAVQISALINYCKMKDSINQGMTTEEVRHFVANKYLNGNIELVIL